MPRRSTAPPIPALLLALALPAAVLAQDDDPYSAPPGPNEEPSGYDSLFEQSDLGNVAQAAQTHYHTGQRELQAAEKLARKAAGAPSEERRTDLLDRRAETLERAVDEFVEAIGFERTLVDAYVGLGEAYSGLGKHGEALQVHAAALEVDPESMASFQGWVDALLALNMLGDATLAYENYAQARPELAQVLLDGMKGWLETRRQEPADVPPEAIERLANWLAQHEAGG